MSCLAWDCDTLKLTSNTTAFKYPSPLHAVLFRFHSPFAFVDCKGSLSFLGNWVLLSHSLHCMTISVYVHKTRGPWHVCVSPSQCISVVVKPWSRADNSDEYQPVLAKTNTFSMEALNLTTKDFESCSESDEFGSRDSNIGNEFWWMPRKATKAVFEGQKDAEWSRERKKSGRVPWLWQLWAVKVVFGRINPCGWCLIVIYRIVSYHRIDY